jgi:hypothetical protein
MDYKRIYNELISAFKDRDLSTFTGYIEKHHIIPKSLGGSDAKDNLVYLPYRHHYVAHRLLARFGDTNQRIRMKHSLAWFRKKYGWKEKDLITLSETTRNKISASQKLACKKRDYASIGRKLSEANFGKSKDKRLFNFIHKTGITRYCTQLELRSEFKLNSCNLSQLCAGKASHHKGWEIQK